MISDRPTGVLGDEGVIPGDRYQVVRKLGVGGAGSVYLAEDTRLGRQVAVKVLHPRPGNEPHPRVEREARQAAALSHPNVVQIHDVVIDGPDAYIVMEYVAGVPLDELLAEDGPFSEARTIELGLMLADALAAAHAGGVVHRDIKPSNVLVRADGLAKLADFGTARMGHGDTLTEEGTIVGSAAYVAPEQIQGGDVDHRADLYSLGILLYELVTGERPFVGDSVAATVIQRLHRDPLPPSAHRPVTPALEAVILRAMARDRGDRYADAAGLAADLRALAALGDDVTRPIPAFVGERRRPRLLRVVGGTALALTLLVGAALTAGWGSAVGTPEDALVTSATAVVPELRGMTREGATAKAEAAGFRIRSVREVPSKFTPGTVVDQVPGAGNELPPDAGLVLLVSGGPSETPTDDADEDAHAPAPAPDTGSAPRPAEPAAPQDEPAPAQPKKEPGGQGNGGPPEDPGAKGRGNGKNG
ncbi:MAG: protein kinase [Actinobacteria bacterium]|nr:protein kinase [Actinomycetota bacterium]